MFKLFMFACMLAVVVAAPKPGVFYTTPFAATYTAPVAAYSAYTAPVAAYSAYTAPVAAYSAYSYSVSSGLPYTAEYYYK